MAAEQRFLGELLARRGILPADKLELALGGAARARHGAARSHRELQPGRRDGPRAGARRRGPAPARRAASTRRRSRPRWRRALPIAFAKAHRILVVREDERAVHVVCGDPFDTQALDDLRVIFGKPVEASVGGRDRIEDAINRVYEKQAGEERARERRVERRRGGRERHPRLGRRGARHPLGQLALLAGDEGARERHPHRARGEGGHRPLPHRRRALRRAAGAPRRS